MKNVLKKLASHRKAINVAVVSLAVTSPALSFAAAPAWVADAISAANTTFSEYLGAAAPVAAAVVAVFGGFKLIMGLIGRITQGRS